MSLQNKNQLPAQQKHKQFLETKLLKSNCILKTINWVINQILYYNNKYYESETTIAKRLGISERTVCRAIKLARELGLIKRKRRINNSNIYGLNPELRRPEIIEQLAAVLPALRGLLCLSFLIPMTIVCQPACRPSLQENGGQYKKEEYFTGALSASLETTKRVAQHQASTAPGETEFGEHRELAKRTEHHQPFKPEEFAASLAKEFEELKQKYSTQRQMQSAMPVLVQPTERTLSGYVNEQTAQDFKEFYDERLPRLVESIGNLALAPDKKRDIIEKQIRSYTDRLHFRDIIRLRQEGYPI